ncbi:unnamed protein product [Lymnaea stagnalis]|uniref:EGF-like domain-containing protein n=1 Tax=Lymnaea stagnalis TaxID=6523 RepID=A0AAV2IP37_LYMST
MAVSAQVKVRKMVTLAAASSLVFLIVVLSMVKTAAASITDFYVLPDISDNVYLLSKSDMPHLITHPICENHSADVAFFETNKEFSAVTSYLDGFLKSTKRTSPTNIKGIWIHMKCNRHYSTQDEFLWGNETIATSLWAVQPGPQFCETCQSFCCGRIGVNDSLMTNGLWSEGDLLKSFWFLCKVTNECAFNETNRCTHLCRDEANGYTCSCKPGYALTSDNHTCVDVDECSGTKSSPKPCQHECRNNNGSYKCACHPGYKLNADQFSCADVNECNTSVHMCRDICNNLNGSYNCSCRPGFELGNDSKSCFDVNECNTSNHMCEYACNNVNGSYYCSCPPGFYLGNDSKRCFDVDECNTSNPCDHICSNVNGSYNCSCHSGFELGNNSKSCFDVDECNVSMPGDHICNDVYISCNCTCKPGFRLTSDGRSCVDIDECNTTLHLCNQTCNNTLGSYECTCKDGYKLSSDLVTCQEINKFHNVSVNCERNCTINGSSVPWTCTPGFVLDINDNKTCHDVDECTTQPCNQTCHNTPGSFTCSCHPGFILDDDLVTCRQNENNHQLCPCQCSDLTRQNYVPQMVQNEHHRHLIVSKTHLLSFRLSKGCADDNRFLARAIGCSGCLIAVVFVSSFLATDLMTAGRVVLKYFKHRTPRVDRDRM